MPRLLSLAVVYTLAASAFAAEKELTVEELVERCRKSVVVITVEGRDGKRQGIGSGFIISQDGLIATNMHVIGEGRAIGVELADGKKLKPVAVHATERSADLAIIRVDARDLPALDLGDSEKLKDGQAVVALGNPQGLKHSVVSGVVSGRRMLDGRNMIQLAIPVEPGNSGGPLLDRAGKVHGILTLKSAVTENLGFAMPINALKPLLEKPNPVPMAKWLTFGKLDADDWTTLFGARWRQRAGRIIVDGMGQGFGGRSLCLSTQPIPDLPCEIAVSVKLGDESGAAGLVFYADGEEKHYGFYPSNGELRLTRFDGPDVFTWKILAQRRSEHYRPGDWNHLKVRLDKGRFRCFVNHQLVVESTDDGLTKGRAGLAKFRETEAEFKQFQIAKSIDVAGSSEAAARLKKVVDGLNLQKPAPSETVESLARDASAARVLHERARALDQQAAQLRQLAGQVELHQACAELKKALDGADEKIDLANAALLAAKLDHGDLDVSVYRRDIDRMGQKLGQSLPNNADHKTKLDALNKFFFEDRGFHGSRGDYYHRSNSYLNEVIDDREGLPITLSVLYMELGRRIGLTMEGVGLPGHFVVRVRPAKGEPQLVDVFGGGKTLSEKEAADKVLSTAGIELAPEHLKAVSKRAIVIRILHNLLNLARDDRDIPGALRYLTAIVEIDPEAAPERWMRAILRYQTGQRALARVDTDWLIEHEPKGIDLKHVRELQKLLAREE